MMTIRYYWLYGLAVMLLAGCATTGTDNPIKAADFKGLSLQAVRSNADFGTFKDARVRWGGNITRVENQRAETWLEIVEHPLGRSGQPREVSVSGDVSSPASAAFWTPPFTPKAARLPSSVR
ncbi:MAG: Slp family lipoprotein [Candidatus Competibacteraceae bacterium]